MRALIVGHAYVLGMNQHKFDTVARRHPVDCVLLVPRSWWSLEWQRDIPAERMYPRLLVVVASIVLNGRVGGHLYSPITAWRLLKKHDPDVVQIEAEAFYLSAFEIAALARCARVPTVLFVWETVDRPLGLPRRLTRWFTLRSVDTLIAGSRDAADLALAKGFRGTVHVLPQTGVDVDRPQSRVRGRAPSSPLTVGFVGRVVPEKGVDLLLGACARLVPDVPVELKIVGSGPAESELRRMAARLGMTDHVEWRGVIANDGVAVEMDQLDCLVLPSRRSPVWKEQFGRVLAEAMALGLPVVGSSSGEIPHVIGRDDLVFEEDDEEHLALILRRLATNPEFYREASRFGLDRARRCFSHDHVADRTFGVWEQLW